MFSYDFPLMSENMFTRRFSSEVASCRSSMKAKRLMYASLEVSPSSKVLRGSAEKDDTATGWEKYTSARQLHSSSTSKIASDAENAARRSDAERPLCRNMLIR